MVCCFFAGNSKLYSGSRQIIWITRLWAFENNSAPADHKMILQDITTRKREKIKISSHSWAKHITNTPSDLSCESCTHTRHSPYSAHFLFFSISKSRKITRVNLENLDAIHSNLMWLEWAAAAHLLPISERKKKVARMFVWTVDRRGRQYKPCGHLSALTY